MGDLQTENINKVLYYSYLPDCRSKLPEKIEKSSREETFVDGYNSLINRGKNSLKQSFDSIIESIDESKEQVIPLSSGLDSRMILAHLINHPKINTSDIHTVTLGSPQTYDYEYGQQVAEKAGVKNTVINLQSKSFDWSLESLRNFSNSSGYRSPGRILDKYIISHIFDVPDNEAVFWSGFMGGELAGSHLPDEPSSKWKEAVTWFTQWERYTTENQLISSKWKPDDFLPKEPYISNQLLTYELQLDYTHRQQCLIKDIVQSDRCQTPYMQTEWLEFILNTPLKMRENRKLFKDIGKSMFPQLFSLPTDANWGLSLTASKWRYLMRRARIASYHRLSNISNIRYIHPQINYIDFESELRTDGCLYPAAKSLIYDFSERDIVGWFDARDVWRKHQSGENLANEIRVICSLELYLSS